MRRIKAGATSARGVARLRVSVCGAARLRGATLRLVAALLCIGMLAAGTLGVGPTSSPFITPVFADESSAATGKLTLTESSLWEVGAIGLGDIEGLNALSRTHRVIALISIPGEEDYTEAFQISFDISRVDISTCGTYPMPAILPEPYNSFENDLADFTVEVFDPAIPRVYNAGHAFAWGWGFLFSVTYTYTGTLEELRLWRSDDRGTTWYTYWDGATGKQEGENLLVELLGDKKLDVVFYDPATELVGEVLLAFEVPALRTGSEIFWLNLDAGSFSNGFEGDRDGGDRVRLPWQDSILGGGKEENGSEGESSADGDGSEGTDGGSGSDSEDGDPEDGGKDGSEDAGELGKVGENNAADGSGGVNTGLILSPLPRLAQDTSNTTVAENAEGNAAKNPARSEGRTERADDAPLASEPTSLLDTTTMSLSASDEGLPSAFLIPLIFVVAAILLVVIAIIFLRRQRGLDSRGS